MGYNKISPGQKVPQEVNVIIEIPAHGDPVKYEIDKATGTMVVDRFLSTSMRYPCNYGYIPQTLAEDGDPVDVLVLTPCPLISGAVISARPIGVLKMTDEAGVDVKILAVPSNKLSRDYENVKTLQDLPASRLESIAHFFEHYKDLESNKWVKIDGWLGHEEAEREIVKGLENYTVNYIEISN